MTVEVVVLDVGHGNAAVVRAEDRTVVIDGGIDATLHAFLRSRGITRIDDVLVSHSDRDHVRGLHLVLADPAINVGRVCVNPDQTKDRVSWRDFSQVLADARRRGTLVITALSLDFPGPIRVGEIMVEAVFPGPELVLTESRPNPHSAVIRLASTDGGEALFAADIDTVGLEYLEAAGVDLTARILVFPHHGGRPGQADPAEFAARLTRLVGPQLVLFSTGRNRYDNPLPDILDGVLRSAPNARVACTQLNRDCAKGWDRPPTHLVDEPASGRLLGHCCLGTFVLRLPERECFPPLESHRQFVDALPTPRCRVG